MRLLIQRVKEARVLINDKIYSQIGKGILILFGVHKNDLPEMTTKLVKKVSHLRIFSDDLGKMNLSIKDVQGDLLVVSQFTLYGDCREGRRPDFTQAARGEEAKKLYEKFIQELRFELNQEIYTGVFGEYMQVGLINDGPVTFLLDNEI